MGTKTNPGQFDGYAKAAADEPIFVLLGRDKHAPVLVHLWAVMRDIEAEDPAKVAEASECAADMFAYQFDHGLPTVGLGQPLLAGAMDLIRTTNEAVKMRGGSKNASTTMELMRLLLSKTTFEAEPVQETPDITEDDVELEALRRAYEATRTFLRDEAETEHSAGARLVLDAAIDDVMRVDGGYWEVVRDRYREAKAGCFCACTCHNDPLYCRSCSKCTCHAPAPVERVVPVEAAAPVAADDDEIDTALRAFHEAKPNANAGTRAELEVRLRAVLSACRALAAPAASERAEGQRVTITDAMCRRFMEVGLRYVDLVNERGPRFSEIRQGLEAALGAGVREGETKPFDTTSPCGDPNVTVMARNAETGEAVHFIRRDAAEKAKERANVGGIWTQRDSPGFFMQPGRDHGNEVWLGWRGRESLKLVQVTVGDAPEIVAGNLIELAWYIRANDKPV